MPPSDDPVAGAPAQSQPPSSPPERSDFPDSGVNSLASPGQRGLATAIDVGLALAPATVVAGALVAAEVVIVPYARAALWFTLGFVVTWLAYEVVAVAAWGRTLGSWALGYRVARWVDGKNPDLAQATLRALLAVPFLGLSVFLTVVIPEWAFLFVSAASFVFLSAVYNPLQRGFHDLAGGTVVIRTR
jgi:uncharacterized RDD family membrane protein YckC